MVDSHGGTELHFLSLASARKCPAGWKLGRRSGAIESVQFLALAIPAARAVCSPLINLDFWSRIDLHVGIDGSRMEGQVHKR